MQMKCRVTFEYDEELTKAVACWYGMKKPATHDFMRRFFLAYGESAIADIIDEYRERGDAQTLGVTHENEP